MTESGTVEHTLGLRFNGKEAAKLSAIADQLRSAGKSEECGLFERAADAARTGEPLIIVCHDALEAAVMAAGFVHWGIEPPAIEALGRPTPSI